MAAFNDSQDDDVLNDLKDIINRNKQEFNAQMENYNGYRGYYNALDTQTKQQQLQAAQEQYRQISDAYLKYSDYLRNLIHHCYSLGYRELVDELQEYMENLTLQVPEPIRGGRKSKRRKFKNSRKVKR